QFLDGDADRPPVRISLPHAYNHAGAHAAVGAMVALFERGSSGLGQQVDVSLQESVVWTLLNAAQVWQLSGKNLVRGGAVRQYSRPDPPGPLRHRFIWPC